MTALADAAMERLEAAFSGAADRDRAPAMAAYTRDQFPFLGQLWPLSAREALRWLPRKERV